MDLFDDVDSELSSIASDVSIPEEFEDDDLEEDESVGVANSDSIYPILIIDPKSNNPETKKKWTKKEINARMRQHIEERWVDEPIPYQHVPYVYTGGSPGPLGLETTALEVFERFFTDELVNYIVEASNLYAASERRVKEGIWCKPINSSDLYRWFAVNLLATLHGKTHIKDNWSKNPILKTPIFSSIMSVDRFLYIGSILHTGKDEDIDATNPIWKSQKLIDSLNSSFESNFELSQDIFIDESLMLYRGHHSMIRYVPNKAARFGFKTYVLACSSTGYIYRFFFDAGIRLLKFGAHTPIRSDCPAILNKPGKVVWTLLRGFGESTTFSRFGKGHLLGLDNYYTCPHLFYELVKNQKTDVIGTVRKNRAPLPKSVLGKVFKKNEKGMRLIKYCDPLYIVNWMDKKSVLIMASTSNALVENDTFNRRKTVKKPQCVHTYNRVMPGVDLNDQMKFGRKVARRRVKKYYKSIFYHLLDCVLVNAYAYFKKIPGKQLTTHQNFRLALVEQLIRKYNNSPTADTADIPEEVEQISLDALHLPEYMAKARSCELCKGNRMDKTERYAQTNWRCIACDKYFCQNKNRNCFAEYHTEHAEELEMRKRVRRSSRVAAN